MERRLFLLAVYNFTAERWAKLYDEIIVKGNR